MGVKRQQATRVLLVLAMVLASVWTGRLAASAADHPTNHLTASRPLPGIDAAILRDRLPALRPPVERPSQSRRLVPVLPGMLAAALAVAYGRYARRVRSGWARVRSLVRCTLLEARAPPLLQPA
jgi:hypothetical protein